MRRRLRRNPSTRPSSVNSTEATTAPGKARMRLNAVQTRTCVASGSVGLSNPNPRAEHVRVPVKRPRRANAYRYNRSELNSADQRPHKAEEMDSCANPINHLHSYQEKHRCPM